jgi:hypothetical protein
MPKINIKPLSVNQVWQGKRFKTPAYKKYETDCLWLLPKIEIPEAPYEFYYEFGFSSKLSDLLNPEKPITDIICKRYGIDDRYINRMILEKVMVKKGEEYIKFEICSHIQDYI